VEYTGTWTPPETDITGKFVQVDIYGWCGLADESLISTSKFKTDVFTSAKLDAVQWTVHYFASYTAQMFPTPRSAISFHFGDSGSDNSRIENFTWSVPKPLINKPLVNPVLVNTPIIRLIKKRQSYCWFTRRLSLLLLEYHSV